MESNINHLASISSFSSPFFTKFHFQRMSTHIFSKALSVVRHKNLVKNLEIVLTFPGRKATISFILTSLDQKEIVKINNVLQNFTAILGLTYKFRIQAHKSRTTLKDGRPRKFDFIMRLDSTGFRLVSTGFQWFFTGFHRFCIWFHWVSTGFQWFLQVSGISFNV